MNAAEKAICERRGHQPSGLRREHGGRCWDICRWCGTEYRFEEMTKLLEREAEPLVERSEQ